MGAWLKMSEINVSSDLNEINFENLNFSADDILKMEYSFVGNSSENFDFSINFNDITSSYDTNTLRHGGSGSSNHSVSSNSNSSVFLNSLSNTRSCTGNMFFWLNHENKIVLFNEYVFDRDSTSIYNYRKSMGVPFSTLSFINKISISDISNTNRIRNNSKVSIYKLDAEKVFETTTNSNSTQIDVDNLNIFKGEKHVLFIDTTVSASDDTSLGFNDISVSEAHTNGFEIYQNSLYPFNKEKQYMSTSSNTGIQNSSIAEFLIDNTYNKVSVFSKTMMGLNSADHRYFDSISESGPTSINSINKINIIGDFNSDTRIRIYKLY